VKVLVLNCGSSSIKYQLFEMPTSRLLAKGLIGRIGETQSEATQTAGDRSMTTNEPIADHEQGVHLMTRMLTHPENGPIAAMSEIGACGHRVVHGGEAVTGSVLVDKELETVIEQHYDLAPLHNPANLVGIREAAKVLGDTPQVASFDTAFHQSIPQTAYLYGLPYDMYERHKVRRYGFHGTSHRYVARRAAELLDRHKYDVTLITCHLGNGCSIAAVKEGKSVDTSMGMTPLEGVVMGTRCGDLDPAIVFYLLRKGYSAEDLERVLNKASGLVGISGSSNDVRDLEDRIDAGDERARLALDIFAYRIKKYIGAYLAVLNGCDGVVFTGGIGENGVRMRGRILSDMENLGIRVDAEKNRGVVGKEGRIEAAESQIALFVVPTDEEGAIARDTYAVVNA